MTDKHTWISKMDIPELSIIAPVWTKMLQRGEFENYKLTEFGEQSYYDMEIYDRCFVGESNNFKYKYSCNRCKYYATMLASFSPIEMGSNEPAAFRNCLHKFKLHFKSQHTRQYIKKLEAAKNE